MFQNWILTYEQKLMSFFQPVVPSQTKPHALLEMQHPAAYAVLKILLHFVQGLQKKQQILQTFLN